MAFKRNFIVRNGLEVNETLIYADSINNKIGIGTNIPEYTLDVRGGIGATSIKITEDLNILGRISVANTTGNSGQYLISTGDGVAWQDIPGNRTVQTIRAIPNQEEFTISYIPGLIDVFINGVKLSSDEFIANDGITITLSDPCFGGETVEFIIYKTQNITGISTFGMSILNNGDLIGIPNLITSLNFIGSSVHVESNGIGASIFIDNTYWEKSEIGIHTLSNVGIGTTNPTSSLTIEGNAYISGIITANSLEIIEGNSNQFLKGDGTLDSNNYLISTGSGENLTGIVTSIIPGNGLTISQGTGEVIISSSYWNDNASGIYSELSVGIGTDEISSELTVDGDADFSGSITALDGFISMGSTTPIQILLEGNQLTFIAVGIGSTTLTLT